MSCLMWQPLYPEESVEENLFVVTEADEDVGATPFFSSDTGIVFIKGGNVVNTDEMTIADILVEDGKISAVGEEKTSTYLRVLLLVMLLISLYSLVE